MLLCDLQTQYGKSNVCSHSIIVRSDDLFYLMVLWVCQFLVDMDSVLMQSHICLKEFSSRPRFHFADATATKINNFSTLRQLTE